MNAKLPQHEIVLLGIGHTNAHVLRMWRMNPLPGARLTCVSNFAVATYSGMLPGTLAGYYQPSDMEIDLVRLSAAAGARLILGEVTGLDSERQELHFAARPPLPFDALSIGVGSRPMEVPGDAGQVLLIKPMQTFLARLDGRLSELFNEPSERPRRIVVVGAGAGGFEVTCCLDKRLRDAYPAEAFTLALLDRGSEVLSSMPTRTQSLARQKLDQKEVRVLLEKQISHIDSSGRMQLDGGEELEADLVIWATSARAPSVLGCFDLPKDDRGFLLTKSTLQTTTQESIFAVGDCGTIPEEKAAKAGVHAVRQGPVLWENLRRYLTEKSLENWKPQKSFLTLLNTADKRAILTYKGVSLHARWCWWLKDWIDRGFMAKYQNYEPRMTSPASASSTPEAMQCGGCGSKVPASILSNVLAKLNNPESERVILGVRETEDVAVLENASSGQIAVTTDFFTAFVDDPFLLGHVAAENALSDLYASVSDPQAALAMVTVPHGPEQRQEQFLREVLEGALQAFRPAGVPIVGGHTIEGEQATVGFTILGDSCPQRRSRKAGLRLGDRLVLTKPLGTGVLLAAHSQASCAADWWTTLVASMLQSNGDASLAAREVGVQAMTDVTGFGLAGHLCEMLEASGVSAEISLESLPLLPGAEDLAGQGIESTLAPGNRWFEEQIRASETTRSSARYQLLFDPQTSGGLLIGVAGEQLDSLLEKLPASAKVIGQVCEPLGEGTVLSVH